MSSLLKDMYSANFYNKFCDVAEEVFSGFDRNKFIKLIFGPEWNSKELKDRMKHTSFVLHQFMPGDFEKSANIIRKITAKVLKNPAIDTPFAFMFLPDYIEKYGINHFGTSVKTMEFVTQLASCEFAIRPFLIKYADKMHSQMLEWSNHENHHVRRLASEGIRPRLPWAMAVPQLKKNPKLILPILENLKTDSSEYVRRSVANNLNDIAKDHPDIVISIAKNWKGIGADTDAIIKHGCRTLLKQGNKEALKYFKLSDDPNLEVSKFKVHTPKVKIGSNLDFAFTVKNGSNKPHTIRLEYAIYFLRKNGEHSKKVFKISERIYKAGETSEIRKQQSFRIITTRQYYPGRHKLSVIVNGQEKLTGLFQLLKN